MNKEQTAIILALLTAVGSAVASYVEHVDPSEPQQEIAYPLVASALEALEARADDLEFRLVAIEETLEGLPGSPVVDVEGGENEGTFEGETSEKIRSSRSPIRRIGKLPTTQEIKRMR